MRYLLLFILAYLVYRYVKPLLQKPPENPHVKGNSPTGSVDTKKSGNIEDAEFEELD